LRFVLVFGVTLFLVMAGVGAVAYLVRLLVGREPMSPLGWLLIIALALLLPGMAARVGSRAFRRIAAPLADVMAAADAVAEGDFSVRVPERGPGEFARLAQSFNRMARELERADQQRRNLTADVAHELRTPLQVIQGNLEGILDGVYEPTRRHIDATLEETRLLTRLVEDLRTLSLAESGQLPLQWETVDLADLLHDVQTSFSGQAEAAGIALQVETSADPGKLAVRGDAGRLDQVLSNLVANALRHTPAGGSVFLRAEPTASGARLVVSDTGEGIAEKDLPYVFDRFWRGDRSRSRAGGAGSGLGLAIARQLVQNHGGHIRVESEVGRGTTFVVDLPAEGRPPEA
jgi:two-component system OmpR family sensor kinase/two-component system sensor histidine kinase BaeS